MTSKRLTGKTLAFVTRERVVRLATVGRRGPQVVPVCHAVDGGHLYFGSAADSPKVRHLRRRPAVSLAADRYSENWRHLRGVMVTGRARVFARGPEFDRGVRLLYRKYRQYERLAALEPGDSVIVRVTPTRVFRW